MVGTGEEVLVLGGGVGRPNQSIPDMREILPSEGAGDGGGPIRRVGGWLGAVVAAGAVVVPGVARRTSLAGVANKRLWRDGWARLRWWAGGARLDWRALAARLELELEQALWLLVEVEALVAPYGVAAGGSGGRWTPVLLPRSH